MTVVIPCYRCAATVDRAARSLLAQTRAPAEIVFVDDASDDGSAAVLQALARSLRARVLTRERNGGAAAARNDGWHAATEKYVAFLDADASWHPLKLELQHRFMEAHPDVPVSGHLRAVMPVPLHGLPVPESPAVSYLTFAQLLWTNPIAPSSMMVRRDLRVRFPHGMRRMEDQRFLLEATRAGCRVALLKARLAAHHKPDFGAAGLSADLVAMERAELANYRSLYRERALSAPLLAVLYAWSLAKFVRRVAIVAARRLSTAA